MLATTQINPLRGVRVGRKPPRPTRRLLLCSEVDLWVGMLSPHLGDVLTTLYDTGCRPAELIQVTASDYLAALSCWSLREHKTAKTGRPRVVHLTPRVAAICDRLTSQRPTGPLFRSVSGKPWRIGHELARAVRNAFRAASLTQPPKLYDFRQTFVTDMLARGESVSIVASLIGHSGTAILEKHYSHLTQRSDALRASLRRRVAED
jgi:integrase